MNYSFDKDILIKYFSGLASPEEVLRVEEWRSESENNESYFQELQATWRSDNNYQKPDVDFYWQQLQNKITPTLKVTKKQSPLTWLPYAAILILTLGFGIWQFNKSKTAMVFEYNTNKTQHLLKEGAYVELQHGARLEEQFSKDNIWFQLTGNATFDFKKPYPEFLLRLPTGLFLKDIGTQFTIEGDDNLSMITVLEGKVEVWNTEKKMQVSKNQVLTYKKDIATFDLDDFRGNFEFKDKSLKLICENVGLYFHTKININDKELENRLLTLQGKNFSLTEVLDIISTTLDINYEKIATDNIVFKTN